MCHRAVTQVSRPAITADATMLARGRSTLIRHRGTPGTDASHSLLTQQPLQLHDVAVVDPHVPDTAAVEVRATPRVDPPRQPVGAPRSTDVQRRTHVQRAVVLTAFQTVAVLFVVHRQPQRSTVPINPHVMRPAVGDPWSNSQPIDLSIVVIIEGLHVA